MGDLSRRAGEPAASSAGAETANENRRVEGVVLHPDAVAEHGPAAERARRIDRDDPDRLICGAQLADEAVDQRRLAGARRSRDADDVRVPEARIDARQNARDVARLVLDAGHEL